MLDFTETRVFSRNWVDLDLDDEDLMALQIAIMARPKGNPIEPGTGGLRKIRFSPSKWKRGKRGAMRIGYVYFEEYSLILLVTAFGKNEKAKLSGQEKKVVRALIAEEWKWLLNRPSYRGDL